MPQPPSYNFIRYKMTRQQPDASSTNPRIPSVSSAWSGVNLRVAEYTSSIAAYDAHSFFAEVCLERFNSDCLPQENLKEVPMPPSLIGKQAVVVGAGMAGLAATRIPRGFLRARHRLENDALPKA